MIAVVLAVASGVAQVLAPMLAPVLAETDSDGSTLWLLLLGPAGAVGVYWSLYRFYRNTDKSHQFERETLIEAQPVTGGDTKVDEVHGTRRSRVEGDNSSKHRERVQRVR